MILSHKAAKNAKFSTFCVLAALREPFYLKFQKPQVSLELENFYACGRKTA